jgi:glycosyltransferase involved in cell wall biosynthesis
MGERLSLAHRLWRVLPAGLRRAGLQRAAVWAAPVKERRPPVSSQGVVVGGEFSAATGLGDAARILQGACAQAGFLRGTVSLGVGRRPDVSAVPADAMLVLTVNAPSLPLMLARAPRSLLAGGRVVASMAWELSVVPNAWRVADRFVHEIWACSDFCAAALEPVLPGRVRVVPYPLAMLNPPSAPADRADFGLPPGAVVTTVIFGLGSSFTRKNPLAAIAAFKLAFGDRPDQVLAVKFSGAAAFPAEAAQIRAAVEDVPNIFLFEGSWPAARIAALLAESHIVLSLHRAEGFGLVPAQAMLLGIPVVATAYSGNLQFMDEQSAALVGYQLVPVEDPARVYGKTPGAVWAEPDVGDAAEQLRRLGDDAAWRSTLGERGRVRAQAALNGSELLAALAANGVTA